VALLPRIGWRSKRYANARGIQIVGDIPIFVAMDSADAWTAPDQFFLDAQFQPTVVAGVPPDYFSATGQLWGNPLYRWDEDERGWLQHGGSTACAVRCASMTLCASTISAALPCVLGGARRRARPPKMANG
jgi:hypothetical protein